MLVAVTNVFPLTPAASRRTLAFQTLANTMRAYHQDFLVCPPQALVDASQLHGWEWMTDSEAGRWCQTTRPMGQNIVFFDAMYLGAAKSERRLLRMMKRYASRHQIPWFNPTFAEKPKIFEWISDKALADGHVPTTHRVISNHTAKAVLEAGGALWLKPIFGSGGMDIFRIQPINEQHYQFVGERTRSGQYDEVLTMDEVQSRLQRFADKQSHFMQDNVELLESSDGRKIDFRVTLVRDETGVWKTVAVTLRRSRPGSFLTNYHAGGSVHSITCTDGLAGAGELNIDVEQIKLNEIEGFAHSVAQRLEELYPQLGILGLDIAQTADGSMFVYDCNTRPGRDILTTQELVRFMQHVAGFAVYLHHRHGCDSV